MSTNDDGVTVRMPEEQVLLLREGAHLTGRTLAAHARLGLAIHAGKTLLAVLDSYHGAREMPDEAERAAYRAGKAAEVAELEAVAYRLAEPTTLLRRAQPTN